MTGTILSVTQPAVGSPGTASWADTVGANFGFLSGAALGEKNPLINSVGFPTNQRGASSYSATGYTVDRWLFTLGTGATSSISVAAPTVGLVAGFTKNFLAWARTVAGTTSTTLEQRIEGASTYAAQTVTVSILCNTGGGSVDFVPSVLQNVTVPVTTSGATLTATTTLQTLSTTIPVPSLTGKVLNASATDYLSLVLSRAFNSTNGATGTLNIYAVQIELGTATTPWENPAAQEVLAQCQRYYNRLTSASTTDYFAPGLCASTVLVVAHWRFPCTMRANPTFASSGAGVLSATAAATQTGTANSAGNVTPGGMNVNITVTAATAGQGAVAFLNAVSAWVEVSAEL